MKERSVNDASLKSRDVTIRRLRNQLEQPLGNFQDIIDVKTSLDREIQINKNLQDTITNDTR